ncbi:exported hypothetical protein [Frankia sp. AgKG'84/4]
MGASVLTAAAPAAPAQAATSWPGGRWSPQGETYASTV